MSDPAHDLLAELCAELAQGDVPSRVLAATAEAPAQLMVSIGAIASDPDATVHVCFLPGHDDPAVLQYLVIGSHDVPSGAVATTARLLHLINSSLPLTGFELGETFSAVVFRHVHAAAVDPLDPAVVAWTLSMVYHAVSRFDALIGEACAGAPYPDLVAGHARLMAALFAPEPEATEAAPPA